MTWIVQNAGTIVVGVLLIIITGLALRNVIKKKNTCSCGSCSGNCCGCVKGRGYSNETYRNKA
ncbi:MAG: FeoB-associated Cys-rich membrane protein [Oscillospiraceae bacterium]|nr:FeoB-associated Cys-rich membrane protein [Oscillospiraceae bacterium]